MVSGTEPNAENKLFVGGCPPGSSEEDLRQIFEKHGQVEEVFIMRGGSRSGMACAFIRYATQPMAQAAIDAIHGQITLPKTAEPLVVRWADAPGSRRRESRRGDRPRSRGGSRDGGSAQQGFNPYMGMQMHPSQAAMAQMQMQMHPQMGGGSYGGYYAQQQNAMQSWQYQQMAQMAMMGYPGPPMGPPHAMMMGGSPQQQMAMAPMGDPRMAQGFGHPGVQQTSA